MIRCCYYKLLLTRLGRKLKIPRTDPPVDVKAISLSFRPLPFFFLFSFALCCTQCLLLILVRCVLVERTDSKYTGYDYSVS
jgi:hypothetical protein